MSGVGDAFGGFEANIKLVEKFMKPNGKLVIGEAFANSKDVPKELIDFEGQLLTLHEIYQICRKFGYYITHMAGGNHNEWERYVFKDMNQHIINGLKKSGDKKFIEWIDYWFDMYFNYRREHEGWALFVLE